MMMLSSQPWLWNDLPSGCRRVKCLIGQNYTYIDTGISFNDGLFACTSKFRSLNLGRDKWFFGSWVTGNDSLSIQCGLYYSKLRLIVNKAIDFPYYDTNWHTLNIGWNGITNIDNSDNIEWTRKSGDTSTCLLFTKWLPNKNPHEYDNHWAIEYFKIARSDTMELRRDFIPVVKDNVGYMYDKVSKQLFGNIGTGVFTWEEE